jgi:hypothetical protein
MPFFPKSCHVVTEDWLLGGSDANGANGRVGEACCGGCAHGGHPPWTEPIPVTQVMSLLVCASRHFLWLSRRAYVVGEGSNWFPISVGPLWLKLCHRGGDAFED